MKIRNSRTIEQLNQAIRKRSGRNEKIREKISSYRQRIKDLESKIYEAEKGLRDVGGLNGNLSTAKRLNAEAIGAIDKDGLGVLVVKIKGKWYIPQWKEGQSTEEQPSLVEVD